VKKIFLNSGETCFVDDEDFALLSRHKWWKLRSYIATYAQTKIGSHCVSMHRLIMGPSSKKSQSIDHIDGNGLNNQKANLRFVSPSHQRQNTQKRKMKGKHPSSRFVGVSYIKTRNCWVAGISFQGKRICKTRTTEIEAAKAYDEMARKMFGPNCFTNEKRIGF
jgi:hypothetical protein